MLAPRGARRANFSYSLSIYTRYNIIESKKNMGEIEENEKPRASGCCIIVRLFRRPRPRRCASVAGAIPQCEPAKLITSSDSSEFKHGESDKASLPANLSELPPTTKTPLNPTSNYHKAAIKPHDTMIKALPPPKGQVQQKNGISTELDDLPHSKRRSNLVRASSSNVMVFGNLGNIRGKRKSAVSPNRNVLDYLPKTAKELGSDANNGRCVNSETDSNNRVAKDAAGASRDHLERLDAEELKEMGNEEYKKGRYAEAVALYDRAIMIDPDKASYWSNKAAALMGLGQLLEAVVACREAVRIDPSYCRAHYRLATLYTRFGNADKAIKHYKLSRTEASPEDISRVQALQTHLAECDEARKLKDWHALLKLTQCAVSAGADSAPQVFASQAEALLNLLRHEEADAALTSSHKFDMDASTNFFGAAGKAYVLAVRAQVDMAAGRFEDAVAAAQKAAQLDPNSRDLSSLALKALAVASARSKGNDLFMDSKFGEACTAYGEGLDNDPYNAILLCNRAACQSKLGQWEKAIEDCSTALKIRPSYSKARLRRADCNAKLERWEASIEDYEVLLGEMPGDEEVVKALFEAHVQLKKQQGEGVNDSNRDADLVLITSEEQFRRIVMLPGLSVALFFEKSSEASEHLEPFMEQLRKRFPSVKFLKVDVEENPYLAKSECISSVGGFKIYKNGSHVKDIAGSDHNQIESSLKSFSE